MQIELQGFDRLNQAFMRAPELVEPELVGWMETTSAHLRDEITAITPKKTGALQNSIQAHVLQTGTLGVSAIIGTPLNYALPIEFGSKPHDIVAKNGGALRFMFRGVPIMVKKVHHPGFDGFFMFKRAVEANKGQIQESFNRMVDRVLNKIFQA